jgi:hypothetical protein
MESATTTTTTTTTTSDTTIKNEINTSILKQQLPLLPHESVKFGLCSTSNTANTAPKLDFISSIEEHLRKYKCTVDEILTELNALHTKYKTHEKQILTEKLDAQSKIPDLEENIRLIRLLRKKLIEEKAHSVNVRFMAADSIWAEGLVIPTPNPQQSTVCLWLGANTMMEYTYDEAEELLTKNLIACNNLIKSREEDLIFLKHQTTTCEVTISRFYNYQVNLKKNQGS